MKRTDKERIERALKRVQKQQSTTDRRVASRESEGPGYFSRALSECFQYDEEQIYNIMDDDEILELVLEMKETLQEKQWEGVIRKAVKNTKVKDKDQALEELRSLME